MADTITFYTNPMSRGRIVRWMLEEVGRPYDTRVLEYGTTMKAPEYLALNPMGKVPALVCDGEVVTECAAICTFLADRFPEAGLAPGASEAGRGTWLRWMFFAAGPLEAAVTANSLGQLPPPDKAGTVGYGSFEAMVDALETAVSGPGPWILGDRFSAADVYVGSQINWGLMFKSLPERAAFIPYAERLRARPAYIRASEIDDALMPKG